MKLSVRSSVRTTAAAEYAGSPRSAGMRGVAEADSEPTLFDLPTAVLKGTGFVAGGFPLPTMVLHGTGFVSEEAEVIECKEDTNRGVEFCVEMRNIKLVISGYIPLHSNVESTEHRACTASTCIDNFQVSSTVSASKLRSSKNHERNYSNRSHSQ